MAMECNQMVAHLVKTNTNINKKGTYWFKGLTKIGRKKEDQCSFLLAGNSKYFQGEPHV